MPAGEPMADLLTADDGPAFIVVNPEGRADCLVVCDHASNRTPGKLGQLGLEPTHFDEHVAWDIGAEAIARRLAERLDAPAVIAGFSRLVVDCNRYLDDPSAFVEVSDQIDIPSNQGLSEADKAQRADAIFRPYHDAIARQIDQMTTDGRVPAVIAAHTMTPQMRGRERRPQDVTVCWSRDGRLARPFLKNLQATSGLVAGDNEPYGLDLGDDYTVPEHAMRRGLPNLQFEVRQDLVADQAGAHRLADILYDAIAGPLASPAARSIEHHWPLKSDVQPRR